MPIQGMPKGYHLSVEGLWKGYPFLEKWDINGNGLDVSWTLKFWLLFEVKGFSKVKAHLSQRLKWRELIPILLAWSMCRSIATSSGGMLVHCMVTPQHYVAGIVLYTWVAWIPDGYFASFKGTLHERKNSGGPQFSRSGVRGVDCLTSCLHKRV